MMNSTLSDQMPMNTSSYTEAAAFLIDRRKNSYQRDRLPSSLRPISNDHALAIQRATMETIGQPVGGWKTVLPAGDTLNVAPIFVNDVHKTSPCPIRLDHGVCRIEPEIGFRFAKDLPPREAAYSDEEIKSAIGSTHMALELIENRYSGTEEISYLENLADCLFNQGLFVGPEIPMERAINSAEMDFVLTQGEEKKFKGQHPNSGPILPVLWIANFLREQGIGIKAGQVVITGSFAGVHEVQPGLEFTMEYGGLGVLKATFKR